MRTQIPGELYFKDEELLSIVLPQEGVLVTGWTRDKDRFVGLDIEALRPYLTLPAKVISGTFNYMNDGKYLGECHILEIKDGKPIIQMIDRSYI